MVAWSSDYLLGLWIYLIWNPSSAIRNLMSQSNNEKLKIMILEDEEDILILYKDFLVKKGYEITTAYHTGDDVIDEVDNLRSDIYMIDYRLPGNKNGIDVAIEILSKFPTALILIITAYEQLRKDILKNPVFYNKNIAVLVKPVKLDKIECTIFDLVKKSKKWKKLCCECGIMIVSDKRLKAVFLK